MKTATGEMKLPILDGKEVSPGVFLIGEPSPVIGTDKLRCLADASGMLVLVELRTRFISSWPARSIT